MFNKINISGIQLFYYLLWFIIISIIIWQYIWWNLWTLLFCLILISLIVFAFVREWIYERNWLKFDDLLINSDNIDYKISELSNDKKYWKYVKEYFENKKYILEKDNELIIISKLNNEKVLLKINLDDIQYYDSLTTFINTNTIFNLNNSIKINNIINIEEYFLDTWRWLISWIMFNLKNSILWNKSKLMSLSISWKQRFIAWENSNELPIRRVFLLYKIKVFLNKNNIDIWVNY